MSDGSEHVEHEETGEGVHEKYLALADALEREIAAMSAQRRGLLWARSVNNERSAIKPLVACRRRCSDRSRLGHASRPDRAQPDRRKRCGGRQPPRTGGGCAGHIR